MLETHLAFSQAASPRHHAHTLDLDGLMSDDITFCVARRDGGFAAARRLYESVGFEVCEPFDDYTNNPSSICMSIAL